MKPAHSHIMVVDGSAVSREIVARILANVIEGARIDSFASGEEALQALEQGQYNLVTTSLMLPDMDGLDLCRRLRRSSQGHHYTPVVVISGDADSRLLKEGFAAGVTDYFDKSLGYPAFGAFIQDFCQRNSGLVGRVLYVEDSRTAAMVTIRLMEKHGLRVTHVTSAEQALARIQRLREEGDSEEEGFDIVVSDFHLKDEMTGGDLLHAIRTRYHFSRQELPLLMITGNDDIRTQIEAFHAGANDFVNKPLVEEIVMARLRSLLLIKQQYDALQRQTHKMEKVATTDSLTGVRNRHYMRERGDSILAESRGGPFWVLIIDIDHFKQINDTLGHLLGDHVLAAMGSLLNRYFPDGVVVRFGGEEFAVLLPTVARVDLVRRAESLRQASEDLLPEGVHFTVSMGIAGTDDHPDADLNRLLQLADLALYHSKNTGRNRISITPSEAEPEPVGQSIPVA
ncbi:MAG: response regulator [Chromatiales bacterium]|nr:response regulator [Gammaproteobacteria bacterium]MBW6475854.1 response regulator [Chromatiales bacterium]